ncbi:hypothetical protein [Xylella fastidiosa]|nr:hypothetical protein [Xylella fastidiosa]
MRCHSQEWSADRRRMFSTTLCLLLAVGVCRCDETSGAVDVTTGESLILWSWIAHGYLAEVLLFGDECCGVAQFANIKWLGVFCSVVGAPGAQGIVVEVVGVVGWCEPFVFAMVC